MQGRMWGNSDKTIVVGIDSCKEGTLTGYLFNARLGVCEDFQGLMQLLLEVEELLDEMNISQAPDVLREFSAPPEKKTKRAPPIEPQPGKCATFAVQVLFRQNASWQGSVTWLDVGREEVFRSALELCLLMNSALTDSGSGAAKKKRPSTYRRRRRASKDASLNK